MKLLAGKYAVAIIVILCIVSRLPQLLSPNLVLDGDECMVGLMAKHMLELKAIPWFLYGQSYGFSLVECLAIVPFYAIAGMTTLSVKCAMLLLWTIGIVLLYNAFLEIYTKDKFLPIIVIMIMIFSPAWAVFSMKAYGGYLTAFMLTSVLLYLNFQQTVRKPVIHFAMMGLLSVLIFESQPLWIPGLVPLVFYRLIKENNWRIWLAFLIPLVCAYIPFYIYRSSLVNFYTPPMVQSVSQLLSNILRIPYYLFSSLHGNYFSYQVQQADAVTALFAALFCGIIILLLLAVLYNLLNHRKGTLLFNLSVLSVALTLLSCVYSEAVHPRYLLPVSGYILLSVVLFLQTTNVPKGLLRTAGSCMIVLGAISMIMFKDFNFSTMRKDKFGQMLGYLNSKGVHYVYCYDYMLAYQVIFYMKENTLSREKKLPGRYPLYSIQVDSALNSGAKTALITDEFQLRNTDFKDAIKYNGYCIVFNPSKNELGKIFELQQ